MRSSSFKRAARSEIFWAAMISRYSGGRWDCGAATAAAVPRIKATAARAKRFVFRACGSPFKDISISENAGSPPAAAARP